MTDLNSCPFCKEADFDLIGLRWHLQNGKCEQYNNPPSDKPIYVGACACIGPQNGQELCPCKMRRKSAP